MHYMRTRRHGDPFHVEQPTPPRPIIGGGRIGGRTWRTLSVSMPEPMARLVEVTALQHGQRVNAYLRGLVAQALVAEGVLTDDQVSR